MTPLPRHQAGEGVKLARGAPLPSVPSARRGLLAIVGAVSAIGFLFGCPEGSTAGWGPPPATIPAVPSGGPKAVGLDFDGDGELDPERAVANSVRGIDVYRSGAFGALRDGSRRTHLGVYLVAIAGEAVRAPIAGVITRMGPAYAGQDKLKFVEIANPTTNYVARGLYVGPLVRRGVTEAAGDFIGPAQSLTEQSPKGITTHVHVEFTGRLGDRLDPLVVLPPLAVREAPTA